MGQANSPVRPECEGAPPNCSLLTRLESDFAESWRDAALVGDAAVLHASAVGLVIEVWRNGPVEDMHAGVRGPDDAAMFAESTALHSVAVAALTDENRGFGLLDFEDHLLNRSRSWAGTGGRTLSELGYGFLGAYSKHVKSQTNILCGLAQHTCVGDPLALYLVPKALGYGHDHLGMPGWRFIVERIGVLLGDPAHPAWREAGRGVLALREMPEDVSSINALTTILLTAPAELSEETLQWLSRHLLHCAGPPFSLYFR